MGHMGRAIDPYKQTKTTFWPQHGSGCYEALKKMNNAMRT
jgi:hypothetical protein